MRNFLFILFFGFSVTVFSQDSTNTFEYNYRKGMECYNEGVVENNRAWILEEINEDSIRIAMQTHFKKALPFLQKAYSINPKDEEILTALQGTYFSLYEFDKSDKYKKELEALNKK